MKIELEIGRFHTAGFEGRIRGHDPRNTRNAALAVGNSKEMDFPLVTSKGINSDNILIFCLVRFICNF